MAKPKQKRVEEARGALELAQQNLAQKQASLAKVRCTLQWIEVYLIFSIGERCWATGSHIKKG